MEHWASYYRAASDLLLSRYFCIEKGITCSVIREEKRKPFHPLEETVRALAAVNSHWILPTCRKPIGRFEHCFHPSSLGVKKREDCSGDSCAVFVGSAFCIYRLLRTLYWNVKSCDDAYFFHFFYICIYWPPVYDEDTFRPCKTLNQVQIRIVWYIQGANIVKGMCRRMDAWRCLWMWSKPVSFTLDDKKFPFRREN